MKKILLLLSLVTATAFAVSDKSWKSLQQYLTGSANPMLVSTNATIGSLYFSSTGKTYIKQDDGYSTNWLCLNCASALLTTKGDMLGFSTVLGRIPVGINGYSPVADSTNAFGWHWAAPAAGAVWGSITGTLSSQSDLAAALALKAPLASPTFSGTVNAPALNLSGATASKVAILDSSKNLVSSPVSDTTLSYLDIGSSLTSLLSGKQDNISATAPLNLLSNVISIPQAGPTQSGYLSSSDYNTFASSSSAYTPAVGANWASPTPTAIPNALDNLAANKAGRAFPANAQLVYVSSLTGSNVVCPANPCGDGTADRPYETIVFALSTITDSSSTKPYVIKLNGARQVETADILLKPYTSIVGSGVRASYIRSPGHSIKPDSSLGSASSWNLLKGFYLGGGTTLNWDLQAVGGSDSVLVVEDVNLGSTVTIKGRNSGGGDYFELYGAYSFGPFTFDSALLQIEHTDLIGAVTITNSQSSAGLSGTFDNVIFNDTVSIDGNSVANAIQLNNCAFAAGSITTSNSGSYTIAKLPFAAASPSYWASPAPSDISTAIDRLAKAVSISGATPIPTIP